MIRKSEPNSASAQLDKGSFVPLYYQIQEILMQRIQSGELAEGDLLQSEQDLSVQYEVSRMTARQALHGLKEQGYAYSVKGRGTFVGRPKVEKNILHLQGFTEEMRQQGYDPASRVIEQTVIRCTDELAQRLRIESGAPVLRLTRLRLADGVPVALDTSHLALSHYPGLDRVNFGRRSLYRTLRERFDVHVGWADEIIEALPAGREEARLLTIAPRATLLCITRTIVTPRGVPIEAARSLYRSDRYRAVFRVPATAIE